MAAEYSIVTYPPEKLAQAQQIPHVDNTDPSRFACVHYLENNKAGGTSFYLHRSTGFEMVNAQRSANYQSILKKELQHCALSNQYIDKDHTLFEQTFSCTAKPNRLLVYPSALLHSGNILMDNSGEPLPRMTITGFA